MNKPWNPKEDPYGLFIELQGTEEDIEGGIMPTCDNCHIETDSYKPYLSSWGSIILCEKCRNDLSDYYKDMEVCKDSKNEKED